jgi:heterodisulfide reductase subunit A-like polyferredoxin
MNVYVLYRDIRTYGEREELYKQARQKGVVFIRYDLDHKPIVKAGKNGLQIEVIDHILKQPVSLSADLLTLASAVTPYNDEDLARCFKVPLNEQGFFVEAHVKLGPSEFASDGVFLCGLAHYPKPIDESVAQAQAAASRAVTLLSRKTINTSGTVAYVNTSLHRLRRVHSGVPVQRAVFDQRRRQGRAGRNQPGAVQGVRVVCVVLPVQCGSTAWIRTITDNGHDRVPVILHPKE